VDRNKRVAFLSIGRILTINGKRLIAPHPDAIRVILGLASGDIEEPGLAHQVRAHIA
jgi:prophage maintenance system killer protein